MSDKPLSPLEMVALETLATQEGILINRVPETTTPGIFGRIPGLPVYQRLVKRGLAFITEEEPIEFDNGTVLDPTPSIELTDEGRTAYRKLFKGAKR